MKVLVVGENRYGGLGQMCRDGFEQSGHRVTIFDYRRLLQPETSVLLRIPVVRRVARYVKQQQINWALIAEIEHFQPELILITKGEIIYPQTLGELKSRTSAILVNWNADSPFNPLVTTPTLQKGIPLYDCYFIYAQHLLEPLTRAAAQRAEYLPFGYDPALHHPVHLIDQERKLLACDVCFAGTWEPEREFFLSELLEFDVAIWGNGWGHLHRSSPLRKRWRGPARYGDDLSKIYAGSKIVLNFLRDQNKDSHNMRTFEVPATGAFLLTTRSSEQLMFLEENRECAYFDGEDELRQKITLYLENDKLRRKIAQQGYCRITHDPNTYKDRMMQLLDALGL